MKLFVVIVLIVAGLGVVAFFVYREAYVSTDFKEKVQLAIDALDDARMKVCDDNLSYIPAAVKAKLAVEEASAESRAATTAAVRISLNFEPVLLDQEHHNCLLEQENIQLDRDIRKRGGKTSPSTPLPDYRKKSAERIDHIRAELQDLP